MKFRDLVKTTRLQKKRREPRAYTQSACGARMTDRHGNPAPIGQVGWSRYETEDYLPEYDTVVGIANALNEDVNTFLEAAGYVAIPVAEMMEKADRIQADHPGTAVLLDLLTGAASATDTDAIDAMIAALQKAKESKLSTEK